MWPPCADWRTTRSAATTEPSVGAAEPLGYRFAVHLTSREDDGAPVVVDPADLATVINAGWRPDIDKALLDGADQQMTAAGALTLAGLTATRTGHGHRKRSLLPCPPGDIGI